MHSKCDNTETMIGKETNEVFDLIISRYQIDCKDNA